MAADLFLDEDSLHVKRMREDQARSARAVPARPFKPRRQVREVFIPILHKPVSDDPFRGGDQELSWHFERQTIHEVLETDGRLGQARWVRTTPPIEQE